MHWLWVHAGLRSANDVWYLWPSGWGSIILPPILTGLTVLAGLAWHSQCAVHGCHWPARHRTAAGDRACWRHSPHERLTAARLLERHHEHSKR